MVLSIEYADLTDLRQVARLPIRLRSADGPTDDDGPDAPTTPARHR